MKTTRRALQDSEAAELVLEANPRYRVTFGDDYELSFEPQLWGNLYVALYQHEELLPGLEKIPFTMIVRAGDG